MSFIEELISCLFDQSSLAPLASKHSIDSEIEIHAVFLLRLLDISYENSSQSREKPTHVEGEDLNGCTTKTSVSKEPCPVYRRNEIFAVKGNKCK